MIQEEFHHVRAYFINGGTTLTSEEEDVIEALLAIGFFPAILLEYPLLRR